MSGKDTEHRIKEAAREVFVQKGYAGARMQDIADLAGINKALLHYYYRSKEKLFNVIFTEIFDDLIKGLISAFVGQVSIEEKIETFIDHYISAMIKSPYIPLFVASEISRNPDVFIGHLQGKVHFSDASSLLMTFISDLNNEYGADKNAVHIFLNILSMCVFPFIAKPMLGAIANMDDETWKMLMETRKAEVKTFVLDALRK